MMTSSPLAALRRSLERLVLALCTVYKVS
jgi:hypothetical protein